MSGTCPALGCGDPLRAVPLYTTPQKYPSWSNTEGIFIPGSPNSGTYRYCVYSGGKFKRWEGGEDELVARQFVDCSPGGEASSDEISTADVLDEIAAPQGMLSKNKALSAGLAVHPGIKKTKTFYRKQLNEWMRKGNVKNISQMDGVIIVSFFLPVIVKKSSSGKWTARWDTESLLSFQTSLRVSWIGLVRHPAIAGREDKNAIIEALNALHCYPIFIDEAKFHNFYNVFCKQTLWPVLHHVAGVYGPTIIEQTAQAEADVWRNYMLVRIHRLLLANESMK